LDSQALWIAAAAVAGVGLVLGFLLGRRASRRVAARARELEERLQIAEEDMTRYRAQVSDHFAETSRLLRDLTVQYRNVYEHLSDGARTLCPDAGALLAPSLAEAALPASASIHPDAAGTADPDAAGTADPDAAGTADPDAAGTAAAGAGEEAAPDEPVDESQLDLRLGGAWREDDEGEDLGPLLDESSESTPRDESSR
jgi:uncharacterized membrane-anchored protein YhcB (DUF1043 family)